MSNTWLSSELSKATADSLWSSRLSGTGLPAPPRIEQQQPATDSTTLTNGSLATPALNYDGAQTASKSPQSPQAAKAQASLEADYRCSYLTAAIANLADDDCSSPAIAV